MFPYLPITITHIEEHLIARDSVSDISVTTDTVEKCIALLQAVRCTTYAYDPDKLLRAKRMYRCMYGRDV